MEIDMNYKQISCCLNCKHCKLREQIDDFPECELLNLMYEEGIIEYIDTTIDLDGYCDNYNRKGE